MGFQLWTGILRVGKGEILLTGSTYLLYLLALFTPFRLLTSD